ncbi:hypothetical protein Hanom_Chr02g00163261 [Helianthus anomalus]
MVAGEGASSVSMTAPAGSAAELASPTHVSKKRKSVTVPALTAFEAMQATYALPLGTTTGMRVENVTPAPAISEGIIPSAASETSLSELIC